MILAGATRSWIPVCPWSWGKSSAWEKTSPVARQSGNNLAGLTMLKDAIRKLNPGMSKPGTEAGFTGTRPSSAVSVHCQGTTCAGLTPEAEPCMSKLWNWVNTYWQDHPDVANSLSQSGTTYDSSKTLKRKKLLYVQALALRKHLQEKTILMLLPASII